MTSNTKPKPARLLLLAAFGAVYLIWGSTYLGIQIAIETIPPFLMVGVRFLIAGSVLFGGTLVWERFSASEPVTRTWAHWRSALIIGTLLLVTGNGVLAWAEKTVPSGIAALIVATVPLWMVVLEALRRGGSKPTLPVIAGLILGLLGIVVLVGPSHLGGQAVDFTGAIAICLASFSWALGSIYSRSAVQTESTLQNVGMQMLTGGTLLMGLGWTLGERIDLSIVSGRSAGALLYLALLGGVVSYSAYVWLLRVSTPAKVATYAFVNPVVAVFLGWGLAGEVLDARVGWAGAAVVGAVTLITLAGNRKLQPNRSKRAPSQPVLTECKECEA